VVNVRFSVETSFVRGHELVLRAVVDGGVHTVALLYVGDESIEEVGWRHARVVQYCYGSFHDTTHGGFRWVGAMSVGGDGPLADGAVSAELAKRASDTGLIVVVNHKLGIFWVVEFSWW
jgi:hypothetical protein